MQLIAYLPLVNSVAFDCTCMLSLTFFLSMLLFKEKVFDFLLNFNRKAVEIKRSMERKQVKIEVKNTNHQTVA